ncbi:MAG: hypothetical protein A2504_15605 [Bdellovibrionales bacterium RIFOXYD12_FULL_39_22]|nr:MAG: hypothetical protein A2385_03035 [Bdellovibrionales bacterium RIFOXYB1_FULL_39_21]OFZ43219.1 MAG: hypothetical protein A2485_12180 [Bdellovibrionales bacterium RIFOXYC12_FULL_39_17]OFZ47957.1 MAG: hypothetical protein A2404_16820 [Bdellovibrionales bacterium RIFOXYC1_FULL_39_130]OFZ73892.1 MAG: hypothetical protein A2451_06205 [Bdellovibrionales bacterium RIFOXYC2_FULL_39_8]OFZ75737.1 MAG: hypothetical protein A2560_13320 [Bdellovibrionales bacterium RIFOXYD1_FULL_39_84]OFZ94227.1 MAG:
MPKMEREKIVEEIKNIIADGLSIDSSTLSLGSFLVTDLRADSLDIMDFMFQIQEKFNINLQKEDFHFLKKLNMPQEQAVIDGFLSEAAISALRHWLPQLPASVKLRPVDLGQYLSLESLVIIVEENLS